MTEVKDGAVLLGAHLNGRKDNEIADVWPGEVFSVCRTRPEAAGEMHTVALLQAAVNRIRAKGDHFGKRPYAAFGVDAMDEWIGQMAGVAHFCPVCHKNNKAGWKSAATVARAMIHRSTIAASFLRSLLPAQSQAVRASLNEAAARYEHICELLAPAVADQGDDAYRSFIGNIERQKENADRVLQPVRDTLLAAAAKMENAAEEAR